FISEEIWQSITDRKVEDALCINTWPTTVKPDDKLLVDFEMVKDIISGIRTVRKEKQISFKNEISLSVINNEGLSADYNDLIMKMGNVDSIMQVTDQLSGAASYRVKSNEYFIPLSGNVDTAAELEKLEAELKRAQGF
ncbi:hypothetical protein CGU36_28080, partial [Pseudomonas fluorescens]